MTSQLCTAAMFAYSNAGSLCTNPLEMMEIQIKQLKHNKALMFCHLAIGFSLINDYHFWQQNGRISRVRGRADVTSKTSRDLTCSLFYISVC